MKIIKRFLKKSDVPYQALQSYRATPLQNGFSPAELLMGRRLRTLIPITHGLLKPKLADSSLFEEKEENRRKKQKKNYDQNIV